MGKKDTITKEYMSNPEYFADAFNYYLFGGKQIISVNDLTEKDSSELGMIFKNETEEIIQKTRDILKECIIMEDNKHTYLVLGIENQSHIHYAMPVKNMIYDALNYDQQVAEKAKQHRIEKDLQGNEFLSGFSKTDKLKPVITLIVYFGTENWDGPRCLKDMFDESSKNVLQYVSDYKLNLIIPKEIDDFSKFKTDFGKAMKYISVADKKEEYIRVSNDTLYKTLNVETAILLNNCIGLQIPIKEGEVQIDMCKAWEELKLEVIEEGLAQGMAQGMAQGRLEGRLELLYQLVTEGLLNIKEAASKASVTEDEFMELMEKAGYSIIK